MHTKLNNEVLNVLNVKFKLHGTVKFILIFRDSVMWELLPKIVTGKEPHLWPFWVAEHTCIKDLKPHKLAQPVCFSFPATFTPPILFLWGKGD